MDTQTEIQNNGCRHFKIQEHSYTFESNLSSKSDVFYGGNWQITFVQDNKNLTVE